MKLYYLIIILLVSGASCASKKKANNQPVDQLTQMLELTKTPCFGRCPTFTLKIYTNGLAILDGKQNLKYIGLYHKKLDKDQIKALKKVCDDGALFTLKDSYEQKVMDLPTTTLTVIEEGKKKTITGNMDFPRGFKDVVSHCMNLIESDGWELKEAYNTK